MNLKLLKRLPLLRDLTQTELEQLSCFLEEETFDMGKDILVEYENEQDTKLYIIFEGAAEVLKKAPSRSAEEISLNILKAGETFGEMGLVDVMVRSATVRAIRTTRVYSLSKWNLNRVFDLHPKIYGKIMRNIAQQISRRLRKADSFQASVLYKELKSKEEEPVEELKEEEIMEGIDEFKPQTPKDNPEKLEKNVDSSEEDKGESKDETPSSDSPPTEEEEKSS